MRTSKSPESAPKPFRSVRAGTIRERLIVLMDGALGTEEIALRLGTTPANVASHIYCLWRDCGIGYDYGADGHVKVVPPKGKKVADLVGTTP